jgi:ABC-type transport system substrate-binding protein
MASGMKRIFFSLPLLVLCAACASTSTPAPQPQQQTASGEPQVATLEPTQGPAECTRTINQFQNIISADVGTGSLDRNVFPRIASDLGPVRAVCASGDAARANRELTAVKKKYGYR